MVGGGKHAQQKGFQWRVMPMIIMAFCGRAV
jgi:hypothetical protein